MSRFSARFFEHVQSAAFYRELHERAVRLLPPASGKTWLDAGCGPGLVTRLAAAHGYRATGTDIDPAMIGQAQKIARRASSPCDFEVAGIDELEACGRKADVVSAASLLTVLGDQAGALHRLLACLNDDGALLVIETTDSMKPRAAWAWLRKNGFGGRNWILLLWAWARTRQSAVRPADMLPPGYRAEHADLLDGLVSAWLIRRDTAIVG